MAAPTAPELPDGLLVALVSLAAKPELNGQHGLLRGWKPEKGRYAVELANGTSILLKPANVEPAMQAAAQFRQLAKVTPQTLATLPSDQREQLLRLSAALPASFAAAAFAPENSAEAAARYEWRLEGSTAWIAGSKRRPDLNGCECTILSMPQDGMISVRVSATGELVRCEETSLAKPGSETATRAAAARAEAPSVPKPPPDAVAKTSEAGDSEQALAQIMHSKNCNKLFQYVDRKGHFVCRMDSIGLVLEVVQAGRAAGPPRPSEFAFSSVGDRTGLKAGSFARLSAHQSNYAGILLGDVVKLCNQRREGHGEGDGGNVDADTEGMETDSTYGAALADPSASESADSGIDGKKSTSKQRRKVAKAAEHAERMRRAAEEAERERVEQKEAELQAQRAEAEKTKAAEKARRAEEKQKRSQKAEAERAAAAERAAQRAEQEKAMAAAAAERAAAEQAAAKKRAAEKVEAEKLAAAISADSDNECDVADGDGDERVQPQMSEVDAQVLADRELAIMLSQMDVEEGEWVTHERKRRAKGGSLDNAAAAWADEIVDKGGVGPSVDEAMARRANRAAQRVLERLNHVVREGAQGSDDTSRRAAVRQMLADSAAMSNDGEPVSDELMQSIEARVATLVRAGLDQKEGYRLIAQLDEAQTFADTLRVWKTAPRSWSLMPISHLWACLARWAKSERRSGREALGGDLDKLLDCTLEQVVAADKESKGGRSRSHEKFARHLSTVLTAAAKVQYELVGVRDPECVALVPYPIYPPHPQYAQLPPGSCPACSSLRSSVSGRPPRSATISPTPRPRRVRRRCSRCWTMPLSP